MLCCAVLPPMPQDLAKRQTMQVVLGAETNRLRWMYDNTLYGAAVANASAPENTLIDPTDFVDPDGCLFSSGM